MTETTIHSAQAIRWPVPRTSTTGERIACSGVPIAAIVTGLSGLLVTTK
jgi:hypothetical protein